MLIHEDTCQRQQVKLIESDYLALKRVLSEIHPRMFRNMWEPQLCTLAQSWEDVGVDAQKLIDVSDKIQELLAVFDPEYVALTHNVQYTENQDGTITLSE